MNTRQSNKEKKLKPFENSKNFIEIGSIEMRHAHGFMPIGGIQLKIKLNQISTGTARSQRRWRGEEQQKSAVNIDLAPNFVFFFKSICPHKRSFLNH